MFAISFLQISCYCAKYANDNSSGQIHLDVYNISNIFYGIFFGNKNMT